MRYAIALPGAPGTHAPPETVVVHLTADLGPNGEPVYTGVSGRVRVQVTAGGIARILDGPAARHWGQCLRAVAPP
ncbi:DUF6296 family protein [Kitasatospora sp. NPDC018058]|uniref:DUF6296 family protein n=1 Tax=Kitasatospora sp. NPDC018058 TaxID=3364025 RepID=UPI0037BE6042